MYMGTWQTESIQMDLMPVRSLLSIMTSLNHLTFSRMPTAINLVPSSARMDGLFSSTHAKLNSVEKDLLSVIETSQHYRHILLASTCCFFCDHTNLRCHPFKSDWVKLHKWNAYQKEIQKWQARKQLSQFYLPNQETSSGYYYFSSTIVQSTLNQLGNYKLVEIWGFAQDEESTKHVFDISKWLLWALNQYWTVEWVLTHGHAMVVYPANPNLSQLIQLRTRYVPNVWEKQPKAPCDHWGQIIKQ